MAVRVLIAPLDWGMGHTTRMIGLAEELQKKECEIIFALPKKQFFLLDGYPFKKIEVCGYNIRYYTKLAPTLSLLLQLPKIIYIFFKEGILATRMSKANAIDLIISDNRPFFRSRKTTSCYLSHQINLPVKGLMGSIINTINRYIINRFDYALIPDFPDNSLSGTLSNPIKLKTEWFFIGPLSRFKSIGQNASIQELKFDMVYIASGPQPLRDKISAKIVNIFAKCEGKHAILGFLDQEETLSNEKINIFGHLPTNKFYDLIMCSKYVVSQSGYTTIMDCSVLSKPLIMWPTKGQWEQEYLAKHLMGKSGFCVIDMPDDINHANRLLLEQQNSKTGCFEFLFPDKIFANLKTH